MMKLLLWIALLSRLTLVHSKAVFAHFMVSNSVSYSTSDWADDIAQAQAAHIDAFALNIANGDPINDAQLPVVFSAAASAGFSLFFSFDYGGNGSWAEADVTALINRYKTDSAYYFYNGKAFVSTFEGVDNAQDWPSIIDNTGCFFIPSWSSLGAKKAMATGVPHGLFSWGAWPEGPNDMFTTTDASYIEFLGGLPYMMPASPWFFTNLPGYHKNWLWRGDNMWYDRWTEIWYLDPEFVEIITWNDYGESHYIGPNRENAWIAFDTGKAPYNYASGMPHDGWRLFLPYVIDIYKNNGVATITQEGLVAWFRPQPGSACATGGTSGNTASQLQILYSPTEIVQDKIFFTALLGSAADITVTVGGVDQGATWARIPDDDIGLWHGNITYTGTGDVVVTVSRSGTQIAQVSGIITTSCTNSIENWNAWVGSDTGPSVSVAAPSYLTAMNCTAGSGPGDYAELCAFACHFNYCPTVCTCTEVGITRTDFPTATGDIGCPAPGYDVTYEGLCSFGCNYGVCPNQCVKQLAPNECNPPVASDPAVPYCTAGTGITTVWNTICAFSCRYNFCPNEKCICTLASYTGNTVPGIQSTIAYPADSDGEDYGLCYFACNRGFCPYPPCNDTSALAALGDDVTSDPAYTQAKLAATTKQNSVELLAYWTVCMEKPQCGPGFTPWGYGHGKVYDADKNAYTAEGCTGGQNGYNRAFCVETGVNLGTCNWRGTATACKQTCLAGEYLLTQNTHIGGAKSGCKAGHFSSLCCTQITIPNQDLTTCPSSNLNNIFTGGLGSAIKDVANSRQYKASYLVSPAECAWYSATGLAVDKTIDQALSNGAIMNFEPGVWEASSSTGGEANFDLLDDNAPKASASDIEGCKETLPDVHVLSTTCTSTLVTRCADRVQNACANYYSIASKQGMWTITCPYDVEPGGGRPVVNAYNRQHKAVWMKKVPNSAKSKCERDEYPPRAFMPSGRYSNWPQWVRLLPGKDNQGAKGMWQRLCGKKNQEIKKEGGLINNYQCRWTISTVRSVNAMLMQFNTPAVEIYDNRLNVNPCSISPAITDDVGFPLLADDPWYTLTHKDKNPAVYALNRIPDNLLSRKVKKRSEDEITAHEIEALARHGYHLASSSSSQPGFLDADFITVDNGNTTRQANADDLTEILRILEWSPEDYEFELELSLGNLYPGETIFPGEFETELWESPVTPTAVITSPSSISPIQYASTLTAENSPLASVERPVLTSAATLSSKKPLPTRGSKDDKSIAKAVAQTQHKYKHVNRHLGLNHRRFP